MSSARPRNTSSSSGSGGSSYSSPALSMRSARNRGRSPRRIWSAAQPSTRACGSRTRPPNRKLNSSVRAGRSSPPTPTASGAVHPCTSSSAASRAASATRETSDNRRRSPSAWSTSESFAVGAPMSRRTGYHSLAMSRIVLALILLAGSASPTRADRHVVSPEAAKLYQDPPVIELVTMGIGALIWERHGHIALCVRYADPRADVCYNYGVASFHEPLSMTWGFFRGTHSFWVAKAPANQMLEIYRMADRTIWV